MRISASFLGFGLFLAFVLHSIWNLVGIFRSPTCTQNAKCFESYFNSKPKLDLFAFVSDNSKSGNVELALILEDFDYSMKITKEIPIELSKSVRNNGSMFFHTIVVPSSTKKRYSTTLQELVKESDAIYVKYPLTKYTIPASASFNLLKENSNKAQGVKPKTHLQSKFSIIMCTDTFGISPNNVPPEIHNHLRINGKMQILPIVLQDLMQNRLRDLVEITSDTKRISFEFTYNPVTIGKMRFVSQIEATLHQFITLGFTEKDLDEVKGVFADTNLYLLCATIFIGSIHLLLDFLSFKNDVKFWKAQKTMAGLSTSGVLWRAFSQIVIFLYLLDEGTSLLVLIPSGIATVIEFWKVSKVLKKIISWRGGFIKNTTESDEELETRRYDEECMKYLSYILYPLCACAAVYSLVYQSHKSWYSWTINSLVNGVYAFGFLFMLPQLFINYRLKSVAALPWRAFTYRAFNTFIDDIFAFIITMPTAHRVACFRDDVVFLIYLYQRWLYPVDKSRRDEITDDNFEADVTNKKND